MPTCSPETSRFGNSAVISAINRNNVFQVGYFSLNSLSGGDWTVELRIIATCTRSSLTRTGFPED